MSEIRRGAFVALLPNGLALVAGGYSPGNGRATDQVHASSELFDPVTRSWTEGPTLAVPQCCGVAATLADGTVLLVGGGIELAPGEITPRSSSVQLLRPGQTSFELAPEMEFPRFAAGGSVLPDGRFLIAGGQAGGHHLTNSAEIFDPSTGARRPTTPMPAEWAHGSVVPLADGRILFAHGAWLMPVPQGAAFYGHTYSFVFDPSDESWTTTGPTSLYNARLLGWTQSGTTSLGQAIPPDWRPDSRYGGSLILLDNGLVLSAGGRGQPDTLVDIGEELYDPQTNRWTRIAAMRWPRTSAVSMCQLSDGRVIVAGVSDNPGGALDAEIFDSESSTWIPGGAFHFTPGGLECLSLPDGSVLFIGGLTRLANEATAEVQIFSE